MAITIPEHYTEDSSEDPSTVIQDVFGDGPIQHKYNSSKRPTGPPRDSGVRKDNKMLRTEIRSIRHQLNQAFISLKRMDEHLKELL